MPLTPRPRAHQPGFDSLEGRELMTAGRVPTSFLLTPVPAGASLFEHIHPHLTIIIDGQQQTVPAGIGIRNVAFGFLPLHTHDTSGTIHVESPKILSFRLRDFFTVWGQTFTNHDVLGHVTDATHRITMTVDGRRSRAFGALLLKDGQQIVIRYDTVPVHGPHARGH